ncbi:MAG: PrsW family intramembrane metalloprotease [Myxococcales bacterium]|nr:PrsW family intramembrane metalloprotease [Myxococcales bacterium]
MPFLLLILSVFAAALPMLGFLTAVWWLDRYEREPPALVFGVFVWGAVGAVILALIGSGVLTIPVHLVAPKAGAIVGPVFIAPLAEEPAKALILLLLLRSRHFDGITDGFVYGAAAGLGFGMTENFLYFTGPAIAGNAGGWLGLVMLRTFFSAVMHAMATSLVGAALGWAKFRGGATVTMAGAIGLAAAMAMHATWNGLITLDPVVVAGGSLAALDILLLAAEFVLVFVVFQGCVLVESLGIRRQLLDEAQRGTLAASTATTLSSWTQRSFGRWTPAEVDQADYTRLAMTLAMRKNQAALLTRRGEDAPLANEIQGLRDAMAASWPRRHQE